MKLKSINFNLSHKNIFSHKAIHRYRPKLEKIKAESDGLFDYVHTNEQLLLVFKDGATEVKKTFDRVFRRTLLGKFNVQQYAHTMISACRDGTTIYNGSSSVIYDYKESDGKLYIREQDETGSPKPYITIFTEMLPDCNNMVEASYVLAFPAIIAKNAWTIKNGCITADDGSYMCDAITGQTLNTCTKLDSISVAGFDKNGGAITRNGQTLESAIAVTSKTSIWDDTLSVFDFPQGPFGTSSSTMVGIFYSGNIAIDHNVNDDTKDIFIMSCCGNITINSSIRARHIYLMAPKGTIAINDNITGSGNAVIFGQIIQGSLTVLVETEKVLLNQPVQNIKFTSTVVAPGYCGVLANASIGSITLPSSIETQTINLNNLPVDTSPFSITATDLKISIIYTGTVPRHLKVLTPPLLYKSIEIVAPCDVYLPNGLVTKEGAFDISILCGGHIIAEDPNSANCPGIISYNGRDSGHITLHACGDITVKAASSKGKCQGVCSSSFFEESGIIEVVCAGNLFIKTHHAVLGEDQLKTTSALGLISLSDNISNDVKAFCCGCISIVSGDVPEGWSATGFVSSGRLDNGNVCAFACGCVSVVSGSAGELQSATGIASWTAGVAKNTMILSHGSVVVVSGNTSKSTSVTGVISFGMQSSGDVDVVSSGYISVSTGYAPIRCNTGISSTNPGDTKKDVAIVSGQYLMLSGSATICAEKTTIVDKTKNPGTTCTQEQTLVTLSADKPVIHSGETVAFTVISQNKGMALRYQWIVNNTIVESGSPTYTASNLIDRDKVSVVMRSSDECSPATSNVITMHVVSGSEDVDFTFVERGAFIVTVKAGAPPYTFYYGLTNDFDINKKTLTLADNGSGVYSGETESLQAGNYRLILVTAHGYKDITLDVAPLAFTLDVDPFSGTERANIEAALANFPKSNVFNYSLNGERLVLVFKDDVTTKSVKQAFDAAVKGTPLEKLHVSSYGNTFMTICKDSEGKVSVEAIDCMVIDTFPQTIDSSTTKFAVRLKIRDLEYAVAADLSSGCGSGNILPMPFDVTYWEYVSEPATGTPYGYIRAEGNGLYAFDALTGQTLCNDGSDINAPDTVDITSSQNITQIISASCALAINIQKGITTLQATNAIGCCDVMACWDDNLVVFDFPCSARDHFAGIFYPGNIKISSNFINTSKDLFLMSCNGNITINANISANNIYIMSPKGTVTINANITASNNIVIFGKSIICESSLNVVKSINGSILLNQQPACTDQFDASGGLVVSYSSCATETITLTINDLYGVLPPDVSYIQFGPRYILTINANKNVIINGQSNWVNNELLHNITIVAPCDVTLPQGLVVKGDYDIKIIAGGKITAGGPGIISYGPSSSGQIGLIAGDNVIINATNDNYFSNSGVISYSAGSDSSISGSVFILTCGCASVNAGNTDHYTAAGLVSYGNSLSNAAFIIACGSAVVRAGDAIGNFSAAGLITRNWDSKPAFIISGGNAFVQTGSATGRYATAGLMSWSWNDSGAAFIISTGSSVIKTGSATGDASMFGIASYADGAYSNKEVFIICERDIRMLGGSNIHAKLAVLAASQVFFDKTLDPNICRKYKALCGPCRYKTLGLDLSKGYDYVTNDDTANQSGRFLVRHNQNDCYISCFDVFKSYLKGYFELVFPRGILQNIGTSIEWMYAPYSPNGYIIAASDNDGYIFDARTGQSLCFEGDLPKAFDAVTIEPDIKKGVESITNSAHATSDAVKIWEDNLVIFDLSMQGVFYPGDIVINKSFNDANKDFMVVSCCGDIAINQGATITCRNLYLMAPHGKVHVNDSLSAENIIILAQNIIVKENTNVEATGFIFLNRQTSISTTSNVIYANTEDCPVSYDPQQRIFLTSDDIISWGMSLQDTDDYTWDGSTLKVKTNKHLTISRPPNINSWSENAFVTQLPSITIIAPCNVYLPDGLVQYDVGSVIISSSNNQSLHIKIVCGGDILVGECSNTCPGIISYNDKFADAGDIWLIAAGDIIVNAPGYYKTSSGVVSAASSGKSGTVFMMSGGNAAIYSGNSSNQTGLVSSSMISNSGAATMISCGSAVIHSGDITDMGATGLCSYGTHSNFALMLACGCAMVRSGNGAENSCSGLGSYSLTNSSMAAMMLSCGNAAIQSGSINAVFSGATGLISSSDAAIVVAYGGVSIDSGTGPISGLYGPSAVLAVCNQAFSLVNSATTSGTLISSNTDAIPNVAVQKYTCMCAPCRYGIYDTPPHIPDFNIMYDEFSETFKVHVISGTPPYTFMYGSDSEFAKGNYIKESLNLGTDGVCDRVFTINSPDPYLFVLKDAKGCNFTQDLLLKDTIDADKLFDPNTIQDIKNKLDAFKSTLPESVFEYVITDSAIYLCFIGEDNAAYKKAFDEQMKDTPLGKLNMSQYTHTIAIIFRILVTTLVVVPAIIKAMPKIIPIVVRALPRLALYATVGGIVKSVSWGNKLIENAMKLFSPGPVTAYAKRAGIAVEDVSVGSYLLSKITSKKPSGSESSDPIQSLSQAYDQISIAQVNLNNVPVIILQNTTQNERHNIITIPEPNLSLIHTDVPDSFGYVTVYPINYTFDAFTGQVLCDDGSCIKPADDLDINDAFTFQTSTKGQIVLDKKQSVATCDIISTWDDNLVTLNLPYVGSGNMVGIFYPGNIRISNKFEPSSENDVLIMSPCGNITIDQNIGAFGGDNKVRNIYIMAPKGTVFVNEGLNAINNIVVFADNIQFANTIRASAFSYNGNIIVNRNPYPKTINENDISQHLFSQNGLVIAPGLYKFQNSPFPKSYRSGQCPDPSYMVGTTRVSGYPIDKATAISIYMIKDVINGVSINPYQTRDHTIIYTPASRNTAAKVKIIRMTENAITDEQNPTHLFVMGPPQWGPDDILNADLEIITPCDVFFPFGLVSAGYNIKIMCGGRLDVAGPGIISFNASGSKSGNIELIAGGNVSVTANTGFDTGIEFSLDDNSVVKEVLAGIVSYNASREVIASSGAILVVSRGNVYIDTTVVHADQVTLANLVSYTGVVSYNSMVSDRPQAMSRSGSVSIMSCGSVNVISGTAKSASGLVSYSAGNIKQSMSDASFIISCGSACILSDNVLLNESAAGLVSYSSGTVNSKSNAAFIVSGGDSYIKSGNIGAASATGLASYCHGYNDTTPVQASAAIVLSCGHATIDPGTATYGNSVSGMYSAAYAKDTLDLAKTKETIAVCNRKFYLLNSAKIRGSSAMIVAGNPDDTANKVQSTLSKKYKVKKGSSCHYMTCSESINVTPQVEKISPTGIPCPCQEVKLKIKNPSFPSYNWYVYNTPTKLNKDDAFILNPCLTTDVLVEGVQDNGCTSVRASFTVTVNDSVPLEGPDVGPDKVIVSPGKNICYGQAVNLSVPSPDPNISYIWSVGDQVYCNGSTCTITLQQSSGIVVTAYNNTDCLFRRRVVINVKPLKPVAKAEPASVCAGKSIQLSVTANESDATYVWYASSTEIGRGATFVTYPTQSTTYSVEAVFNACSVKSDDISVSVFSKPAAPTVTISLPQPICPGHTFTINVTNPQLLTEYRFYRGNQLLGASASGILTINGIETDTTFDVTAFSKQGCESDKSSITVTTYTRPAAPTVDVQPNNIICPGESISLTLTAQQGNTYKWYKDGLEIQPQGNTYTDQPSKTSKFSIVAIDNNGCESLPTDITITVGLPAPTVNLPPPICEGTPVTLTINAPQAGLSYKWYDNANIALATGASYTTGNIGSNTTFYATSVSGNCESDKTPVTVSVMQRSMTPLLNIYNVLNKKPCSGKPFDITIEHIPTYPHSYTYNLYQDGALVPQSGVDPMVRTISNGITKNTTFLVEAIDEKGCESLQGRLVVEVRKPLAPTAWTIAPISPCPGMRFTITIDAPQQDATYKLLDGNGQTIGLSDRGVIAVNNGIPSDTTFSLVAFDAGVGDDSCESDPASVNVTVGAVPAIPNVTYPLYAIPNTQFNIDIQNPSTSLEYKWYDNNNQIATGTSYSPTMGNSDINLSVMTHDTASSCDSARHSFVIKPLLAPTVENANNTVCLSQTTVLRVTSSTDQLTFNWYQGANIQSAHDSSYTTDSILALGRYTFSVEAVYNGTRSAPTQITVNVIDPVPAPTLPATDIYVCEGVTTNVTITNPVSDATYTWHLNIINSITVVGTGVSRVFSIADWPAGVGYDLDGYVEVTKQGCSSSTHFTLHKQTLERPSYIADSVITLCPGQAATLRATSTQDVYFNWYDDKDALLARHTNPYVVQYNNPGVSDISQDIYIRAEHKESGCLSTKTNGPRIIFKPGPVPRTDILNSFAYTISDKPNGLNPVTYETDIRSNKISYADAIDFTVTLKSIPKTMLYTHLFSNLTEYDHILFMNESTATLQTIAPSTFFDQQITQPTTVNLTLKAGFNNACLVQIGKKDLTIYPARDLPAPIVAVNVTVSGNVITATAIVTNAAIYSNIYYYDETGKIITSGRFNNNSTIYIRGIDVYGNQSPCTIKTIVINPTFNSVLKSALDSWQAKPPGFSYSTPNVGSSVVLVFDNKAAKDAFVQQFQSTYSDLCAEISGLSYSIVVVKEQPLQFQSIDKPVLSYQVMGDAIFVEHEKNVVSIYIVEDNFGSNAFTVDEKMTVTLPLDTITWTINDKGNIVTTNASGKTTNMNSVNFVQNIFATQELNPEDILAIMNSECDALSKVQQEDFMTAFASLFDAKPTSWKRQFVVALTSESGTSGSMPNLRDCYGDAFINKLVELMRTCNLYIGTHEYILPFDTPVWSNCAQQTAGEHFCDETIDSVQHTVELANTRFIQTSDSLWIIDKNTRRVLYIINLNKFIYQSNTLYCLDAKTHCVLLFGFEDHTLVFRSNVPLCGDATFFTVGYDGILQIVTKCGTIYRIDHYGQGHFTKITFEIIQI